MLPKDVPKRNYTSNFIKFIYMKMQIYLLLIVFICVNAYSQTNKDVKTIKKDKHKCHFTCLHTEKIDADFRKENKISTTNFYYKAGDKEILNKSIKHDKNGNNIETLIYNESGAVISKIIKEFDSKGNETIRKSYNDNKLESTTTCKYDEFGNLIEKIFIDNINNIQTKVESLYDGNNNLYVQNTFDNNLSLISTDLYKYDSNDNLIEKTTKSAKGKIYSKTTYLYDSRGNMIEENNNDMEINASSKYTFKYDESDNLIENKYIYSGVEQNFFKYKYDNNGNNIETNYYLRGELISILHTKFDAENNKIEEILNLKDGSLSSKTTYTFNNKNLLTGTVYWDVKSSLPSGNLISKYEFYK